MFSHVIRRNVYLQYHKPKSKKVIPTMVTMNQSYLQFNEPVTSQYGTLSILPWCFIISIELFDDCNKFSIRIYHPVESNKFFEYMNLVFSMDPKRTQEAEFVDNKSFVDLINSFINSNEAERDHRKPYLLIVNPKSGTKRSMKILNNCVEPIFKERKVPYEIFVTEKANDAHHLIRNHANLTGYRGVIIVSGDGLMYEALTGLVNRQQQHRDINNGGDGSGDSNEIVPLGIIAAGSGNGLAASICNYSGIPPAQYTALYNTVLLTQPHITTMDLMKIHTSRGQFLQSFLSLTWGLIANIDVGSDKFRCLGKARFTISSLYQIAKLTKYKCNLWYLPSSYKSENYQKGTASGDANGTTDSSLTDFKYAPGFNTDVNQDDRWINISGTYTGIVVSCVPYLATDAYFVPSASINDGKLYLITCRGCMTRKQMFKFVSEISDANHCSHDYSVEIHECLAVRFVPDNNPIDKCNPPLMAIDGEPLQLCSFQAEIWPDWARIFSGPALIQTPTK